MSGFPPWRPPRRPRHDLLSREPPVHSTATTPAGHFGQGRVRAPRPAPISTRSRRTHQPRRRWPGRGGVDQKLAPFVLRAAVALWRPRDGPWARPRPAVAPLGRRLRAVAARRALAPAELGPSGGGVHGRCFRAEAGGSGGATPGLGAAARARSLWFGAHPAARARRHSPPRPGQVFMTRPPPRLLESRRRGPHPVVLAPVASRSAPPRLEPREGKSSCRRAGGAGQLDGPVRRPPPGGRSPPAG